MHTRGSSAWRASHWGAACATDLVTGPWIISTAGQITCHRQAMSAFRALGRVMHLHGYHIRREVTGAFNCRKITGGSSLSSHAQGIGLDVNWDTNPYRLDRQVTDMPRAMVQDCLQITTRDGKHVFRWGGDWDNNPATKHSNYDAMHWEIILTPAELAAGFDVPFANPIRPRTWPLLMRGERGPAVLQLQQRIQADIPAIRPDGIFGPKTEQYLRAWQTMYRLKADAICGLGTWTAIFSHQLPNPAIAPTKA